jgi:OFA family oxalate/formate antiporter-like MFS transporter
MIRAGLDPEDMSLIDDKRKWSLHWAWIILATCFVNLFINYSIRLGYSVILPEMIRALGLGRAAGGTIYNAYLFPYLALTPFTGYLTDRFGARRVITSCCLILGLGILLMGTINSFWMACLFYAIAGLGATGMWTPVITVVQRWFSPNRRGLALGILSTGYGLGFATMGIAFPWVVHHFNWRYAWYFLGTGALVMVLVNGLLLRSDPENSGYLPWGQMERSSSAGETDVKAHTKRGPISIVLKDIRFWLIGFSYLSISYSLYGITTFMVDYANLQIGLPLEKASLLATVHGICQVLGVLTILPLSDYLGRKRTIIISHSFTTICLIGILFSGNSWGMLFVLIGLMALFYGATFPIYGAFAGDYFPRDMMGTVIGAWTPFYGIGAILVHWVTGILRDTTGVYDYAFIINAAMAALGLFLICLVRKSKGN